MQLLCSPVLEYIDFVIWTEKALFIERTFPDKDFCEQNVSKAKEFFLRGILPELIGRWFSRPTPTPQRTMGPGNSVAYEGGEGSSSDRPSVIAEEENMAKWLAVIMMIAPISGFTWTVLN